MTNPNVSSDYNSYLGDVLDQFDEAWVPDLDYVKAAVDNGGMRLDCKGIAELVRSDVDRRHAAGCSVNLPQYFDWFPELMLDESLAQSIGFEDYRSRKTRGLFIHRDLWSWIPNIQSADWFRELWQVSVQERSTYANRPPSIYLGMPQDPIEVEPKVGEKFGDFRLIATLGVGAFSKVFLATQPSLASRYVALKVVMKTLDEPEHLARLQHTGIVPIYSLHRIGAYSILCMPYFGAATLADWLGNNELNAQRNGQSLVGTVQQAQTRIGSSDSTVVSTPSESFPDEADRIRVWNASGAQPLSRLMHMDEKGCLLWLSRRIGAALAHAHERDVIHGDLKPANVLIKNDGEPALIDFNLARKFEEEPSTHVGGTLPYMAPEQLLMLLGRRQHLSAASDVYSLGTMLYQMAENRMPFPAPLSTAESDISIAHELRKDPVRFESSKISVGLKSILSKCLEFEPTARYSSGTTLLEDLDREASNLPLKYAKESFFKSRIPKLAHRYPRLFSVAPILAITTLIVILFAFASWYWWKEANQWSARDALTVWTNQVSAHAPDLLEGTDNAIQSSFATMNQAIDWMTGDRYEAGTIWKLKWLSPHERKLAEDDFYDDLLLLAGLAYDRRNQLTAVQVQQLDRWLTLCGNSHSSNRSITAEPLGLANVNKVYNQLEFRESSVGTLRGIHLSDGEKILQSRALVTRGLPARAIEKLSEITPRTSNKYLYWIATGDAQRKLGHAQAALLSYGLAINHSPRSGVGYARRCQLFAEIRKWEDAERDCTALINLDPKNAFRYAERARVRQSMGKNEDAIADMDEAIELEPSANRFYFFRSRLGRDANEMIKAKEDYQRGLSLTPKTIDDWISRALAQLPRHPEKAMADLRRAEQIEPYRFEVLQNQAHVLSEFMHDDNAASEVLNTILVHDPENDWARVDRCVLLARSGRKDDVLQEVKSILDSGKTIAPSTYYQIACAHCLLATMYPECREKALQYLSRAILGGYGYDLLENDKDLDSIRLEPQFNSLLQVMHLSQQPTAKK